MNAQLTRLSREARESCRGRGHDMQPFRMHTYYKTVAVSNCRKCGKQVSINSRPMPNEIGVGGEAVALGCGDVSHWDAFAVSA